MNSHESGLSDLQLWLLHEPVSAERTRVDLSVIHSQVLLQRSQH